MTKPLIIISGSAYSFLYYETATCELAQEGFLLGSISQQTTEVGQNDGNKEDVRIIRVNSVLPCPLLGYFYNGVGSISPDKLRKFLGPQKSNVVGWYRFSKHQIFDPTLREKYTHLGLAKFFNISIDIFPICLLMRSLQEGESAEDTFTISSIFKLKFLLREGLRWSITKMNVLNLDTEESNKRLGYTPQTFQSLARNLIINPSIAQGVAFTTALHNKVCEHLQHLSVELYNEEKKLFALEEEVKSYLENRRSEKSQRPIVIYDVFGDFDSQMETD